MVTSRLLAREGPQLFVKFGIVIFLVRLDRNAKHKAAAAAADRHLHHRKEEGEGAGE
jgi:hypothetical protein